MRNLLLVMLGGAIGAGFRYQLSSAANHHLGSQFPSGTLIVNLLGSLLAGLLAALLIGQSSAGEPLRLFLGIGMLGGFTTFSAFSVEAIELFQRGEGLLAGAYVASSVIGSLMMCLAGFWLARAAA